MKMNTTRKRWLAALLSLILPGLGQTYCGELLRGGCFLVFFVFFPLLIMRITVIFADTWLLWGGGLALTSALVSYFYALIDSWRLSGDKEEFYQLHDYNRVLFYLAAWLVGTVLILSTDHYMKSNIVQAYKIVGDSMAPTVLRGDYVLAKKLTYRSHTVKAGDIVIAVYPDDRSKVLIRKIESMPGEEFTEKDGSIMTVPHGAVMVRGTGSNAVDSLTFGPLDMRDIVGKVTHIYFSRNERGIRWERIFTHINL